MSDLEVRPDPHWHFVAFQVLEALYQFDNGIHFLRATPFHCRPQRRRNLPFGAPNRTRISPCTLPVWHGVCFVVSFTPMALHGFGTLLAWCCTRHREHRKVSSTISPMSRRSGATLSMRAPAYAKGDLLGFIRSVCGSPEFDHPERQKERQAFFILMEIAHNELTT
jgi:hypothetical protein